MGKTKLIAQALHAKAGLRAALQQFLLDLRAAGGHCTAQQIEQLNLLRQRVNEYVGANQAIRDHINQKWFGVAEESDDPAVKKRMAFHHTMNLAGNVFKGNNPARLLRDRKDLVATVESQEQEATDFSEVLREIEMIIDAANGNGDRYAAFVADRADTVTPDHYRDF